MMYKDRFIAVIKHNGKVLRERDDVVRLPFGSEYSIMFKNLESRKAVVDLSIDGEDVLDGNSLIVPANSNLDLEGYMSGSAAKNKFKFIQKTKEISNHRGDRLDDGIVRVEFRFEKKVEERVIKERKVYERYLNHFVFRCPLCGNWPCTCPTWWYYTGGTWNNFDNDAKDPLIGDCVSGGTATRGLSGGSSEAQYYSSNTYNLNCNMNMSFTDGDFGKPNLDEGITVKGFEIDQNFVPGYTKDLEKNSSVIILRLRGYDGGGTKVNKPLTVKSRISCPTCGRKSKSNAKFCDNCGTFLG